MATISHKTFFLLVSFCLFLGCERKPVEPKPEESSYDIYLANNLAGISPTFLYRYNTRTKGRDSLRISNQSTNWPTLAASLTSGLMYSAADQVIEVINARQMQIIDTFNYAALYLSVSNDGNVLAVHFRDSVLFLNTSSGTVLSRLTQLGFIGRFLDDGRYYAGVGDVDNSFPYGVLRINPSAGDTTRLFANRLILDITYDPIQKWWILYEGVGLDTDRLVLADSAEQTVFSYLLEPGLGEFRFDRESRMLYFTNHGSILSILPPRPYLYRMHVDSRKVDSTPVDALTVPGCPPRYYAQDVCLSPDRRILAFTTMWSECVLLQQARTFVVTDTLLMGGNAGYVSVPIIFNHEP